jgi:hypothetical protein
MASGSADIPNAPPTKDCALPGTRLGEFIPMQFG